jgi:hypothetical protein
MRGGGGGSGKRECCERRGNSSDRCQSSRKRYHVLSYQSFSPTWSALPAAAKLRDFITFLLHQYFVRVPEISRGSNFIWRFWHFCGLNWSSNQPNSYQTDDVSRLKIN